MEEDLKNSNSKKFVIGKIVNFENQKQQLSQPAGCKALRASEILSTTKIQCGVLHVNLRKPFDVKGFIKLLKNVKQIISVNLYKNRWLGSIILHSLNIIIY